MIIFDVATFLVAASLVAAIRTRSPRSGRSVSDGSQSSPAIPTTRTHSMAGFWRTAFADGIAGLNTVRTSSTLAPVLIAMGIVTVGDAIFSSLLGPYFGGPLAASGATLGVWLSLRGVGGLIGTVPAGHLSRWIQPHHIIVISLAGGAAVLATMAAVPRPTELPLPP